ncbi:MAG: hypothetical protein JWL88_489 [Parcubacteria group bacterium]|nr:hypothetical protein [Parcubacteria group bacterium]
MPTRIAAKESSWTPAEIVLTSVLGLATLFIIIGTVLFR